MKQKCNLIVPLGFKRLKLLLLEITISLSKLKIIYSIKGELSVNTTFPELTLIRWYHILFYRGSDDTNFQSQNRKSSEIEVMFYDIVAWFHIIGSTYLLI